MKKKFPIILTLILVSYATIYYNYYIKSPFIQPSTNSEKVEQVSANQPPVTKYESKSEQNSQSSSPEEHTPEAEKILPLPNTDENTEEPPTETENSVEALRVILSPIHRTTLSCEVAVTTVDKIAKRMGESFKKGELLIKLDDTIFIGLLKKAQGGWEKALTQYEAKRQLYQDNIASTFELKLAQSDLATAESDLVSAQYYVKSCTIQAPYDGEVVNVFVEEHEMIQQGKPLIEIVDDSSLLGKLLVPSNLLSKISLNKSVKIKIKEANATVEGKILNIDSVIDPASSMIKVDIEIKNNERKLRSGMIGLVDLSR